MLRIAATEALDGYSRTRLVDRIDEKVMQDARKKFREYAIRGVISRGSFEDGQWILYNEVKSRSIHFSLPDGVEISEWTGCGTEAYKDYVKAYIVMLLGDRALDTLAAITSSLMAFGTAEIRHNKDTLFSPQPGTRLGYLTYGQMKRLLLDFCEEVMADRGFPINIGDTRHLAMISLILSGGSPVICRELAGHESIDISANYYANLSTVVESAVYEAYYMGRDEAVLEGSLEIKLHVPQNAYRMGGGYCDAEHIEEGDVSECMKNYSRSGHFAECHECVHFYPDGEKLRFKLKKNAKDKVDADGVFLMRIIEQVRKGNGAQEEIEQALLRLQNSSADYRNILMRDWKGEK